MRPNTTNTEDTHTGLESMHRCVLLLYDASFQLACYDLSVLPLPHLAATIPLPARLLYLAPLLHRGKANAYSRNRVRSKARRWRFPLAECPGKGRTICNLVLASALRRLLYQFREALEDPSFEA